MSGVGYVAQPNVMMSSQMVSSTFESLRYAHSFPFVTFSDEVLLYA